MIDYLGKEKGRVIEECTECGACARECPVLRKTELRNEPPEEIQKKVKAFLRTGRPDAVVFTRAFSCMECFKCVEDTCPEGLNSLFINEMIKWEYRRNRVLETHYDDPKDIRAPQRVIASIQVSPEEYKRIFTPTPVRRTKYLFFPGCNVYSQPEKILTAMDILDLTGVDYSFVPGCDSCCGDVYRFSGSLEKALKSSKLLVKELARYSPETVIFWCPTCHCRFRKTIPLTEEVPFSTVSFAQFLASKMDTLPLRKPIHARATLHEACKSAFTGIDLNGARDVLKKIPGISLLEAPHHGKDTVCCGSGAISFFPESFEAVRDFRLQEVSEMDIDILVDVCHFCHETFCGQQPKYPYSVVNYVNLAAQAIGLRREDKFKGFMRCVNPDKILKAAEENIKGSPYSPGEIVAAVRKRFGRGEEQFSS
ncbi:MAG: (Fe-S)-binding protein [Deltaproteobacteria bacterium]|nr:(Fe-S)-binding protein [Deltaproteobacteria bacterium]